jgi:methionine-S-sulfoxide reductase
LPGVIRTRVGYAGGTTKNPAYHDLGDHSEAVQIDFDPSRISYRELLSIFWKSHDPERGSWSSQYRAAIFYHNEEQRKLAVETRDHLACETKGRIATSIEPYSGFHIAEDYHQKHSLRLFPEIMMEFRVIYPDMKSLIDSTAVARVNGYLGGYGSCDSLQEEIKGFGLSPRVRETLTSVVCARKASVACPVR